MFDNLCIDKSKLLFPIVLLSIISFEITLYPYYAFTSMASFFAMFFFVAFNCKLNAINEKYWLFILSYAFFALVISICYFNILGVTKAIFTFFSFFLCYILVFNNINLLKIYFYISLIPLFFSLFLQANKEFLIWGFVDGRNSSFMFDPNYCGAFFVSSALIGLILFKNNNLKWVYFLLFSMGVLFTFSKGAILALLMGLLIYLYCNYYLKSLLFVFIFSSFISIFFFYSGFDFSLFRLEQGFNSRDGFLKAVLNHVFYNQNYMGGGSEALIKLLGDNYFENHSTHNFYLDLVVTNGLIPLIILVSFIGFVSFVGFRDRNVYLSLFGALFVASNSISISIGGIGILSLIFTFSTIMILHRKKDL